MEKKKPWILRPVAWLFTCLAIFLLPLAAEYICKLGYFLVGYLDRFSTVVVVILVLMFGSLYLSLLWYSAAIISALFIHISNAIYPTHHAFRFYFVGIYLILYCAIVIAAAILGFVSGGAMFWFYARHVWLAFASIIFIAYGRASAVENQ